MQERSVLKFRNLKEASRHAKVTRQAIFYAIKKGRLKAHKNGRCWNISQEDLDDYRCNKYNYDIKQVNGVHLFDAEKGFYSVQQLSKILSDSLKCPFSKGKLYYLIRKGDLFAEKIEGCWVVKRDDAIALLEAEIALRQLF